MTDITWQLNGKRIAQLLINIAGVLFIYFVPALTHLLNFPLYLIEPIRIVLIIIMLHSGRKNAYFLAATLPLFSYLISAHPVFYKMLLIAAEMTFNVWLFYFLTQRFRHTFIALFVSIIASKLLYYLLKFVFISSLLLNMDLISTPLYIQAVMLFVFTGYAALFYYYRKTKQQ